jgi:hypothetical protein
MRTIAIARVSSYKNTTEKVGERFVMDFSRQAIKDAVPWAVHARRLGRWTTNQIRYPIVSSALELQARGRIMNGPFKGLRAPSTGITPGNYTQLVGVYERSLMPAIETVIARQPQVMINAGAHWGYYALGLAMRCERSWVVAYEMDRSRADVLRKYRRLNDLGMRVRLRGVCTPEALERDVAGSDDHPFVIMDVEGAEDVLLDPVSMPGLRGAEIIVELHEHLVPGVTERLRTRFSKSHEQVLLQDETDAIDPRMIGWSPKRQLLRGVLDRMMDEGREPMMSWLHLLPRQ